MSEVDLAKRRRVMQRSMKLGHCVCDPKRPCPCDVFQTQGICPCAGERPEQAPAADVRLTEMVHNTGCASKIAPADLEQVLARLPAVEDPAVLCGMPAGDDAGVYRLTDDTCVVQTVDVMTPCVDDARTFGRICAANCLSDVYAMGGVPRTALSVLAFPTETVSGQVMYEMLAGAMETLAEADVALIGGHSIKDEEAKLGFAITGLVEDGRAVERAGAAVGDMLVLTKPLGVGVLTFAAQIGRANAEGLAAATESMATLNRAAAEAMREVGVSACTDVTGFGLFGHLVGMVRHAGMTAEIWADALPAFPGAIEGLREGVVPGAVERNMEYVGEDIRVDEPVEDARVDLGFDAQTSGGLLIAVPADKHTGLCEALASRGVVAATVGRIAGESEGEIHVTAAPSEALAGRSPAPAKAPCCASSAESRPDSDQPKPCCSGGADADKDADKPAAGGVAEARRAFGSLIRAASGAGAVDANTKELITFALAVLSRCEPCVAAHVTAAREMGLTQDQLDEAAWCAIAMGGAPVRMFYEEVRSDGDADGDCCCPQ